MPGEGSEGVALLPLVAVVSYQGRPAVLHDPGLEVGDDVPGRRRDLQAVSVPQDLTHTWLLQQDTGRGLVTGDDEPQLLPLLLLVDVHQDLPPLALHLLEFVNCQRVQKLVCCSVQVKILGWLSWDFLQTKEEGKLTRNF